MKHIFLSIIFLLIDIYFINAQTEWAPVGAKWYYTTPYFYSYEFAHGDDCAVFESIGDTIINGKDCKIIEIRKCWNQQVISKEFLYQSNDSIFYLNNDKFYLLYDFSANIGDTVVVHDKKFYPTAGFLFHDSIECFKYVITDLDSINIEDKWYKRQKVSSVRDCDWIMEYDGYGSWITEKIGSTTYFFGRYLYSTPEESMGLLRCYSDSLMEYKNPIWNKTCDYISGVPDMIATGFIKIYPNPANDKLFIETKEQADLTIYNCSGQIVLSRHLNSGTNIVQINFLNPSAYYCRVLSDKGVVTYKFLKIKN